MPMRLGGMEQLGTVQCHLRRRSVHQEQGCCEGTTEDEEHCHQEPCPIDCKWGEWSNWSECDAEYGDGNKHSHRMHLVPAMFGGQECEGDSDQTKACNNLLECRQRVQQQAHEINRLENLLENRV